MLLSEIDRYGFDVGAQPARDFIRSPFPIGTLDPISGLVELKQLGLNNCRELTGTLLLFGHNQHAISFALRFCIGTLEPISGLVQLKKLYLRNCRSLTGTICCSGTTLELTHWWNRGSSSTAESESIDGVEPRGMRGAYWSVSF